ncbi:hypothetical protein PAXRUDRAFT_601022 [Paxillus rubicundulus Ve08.2h10]|uniref:Uncharacterized protein n=1 Tax=Paxillus rubicundulus Ve08.2h10 TaxID=930991 RepID=A0A0D0E421_9AGAM|nr:hypothetical protein PAXRUDRAFT_601022 [Paxillus rubicundulus Ve08.2h10]
MIREDGTVPTALSRRWISSAFHAHICLARFTTRMLFLFSSFLPQRIHLVSVGPGSSCPQLKLGCVATLTSVFNVIVDGGTVPSH